MAKVSPSMVTKALLSLERVGQPMNENQQSLDKTSKDLAESFDQVAEARVWSKPMVVELIANAAFQPAYKVNQGQTPSDFLQGKLKKILDRQHNELRLMRDSLDEVYISKIEELKIIHQIEKLTHFSADLDDVPVIHILKNYLPAYLTCRKKLAELNNLKVQFNFNEKALREILQVSSLSQNESDRALSALNTSIKTGIDVLKSYKTLSRYNEIQGKLEKKLGELKGHSQGKKVSADLDIFSNISDPDKADPADAQKKSEEYKIVKSIEAQRALITQLEIKVRLENDSELSTKSIYQFDKVKAEIQDAAKGCCSVM